MRSFELNDEAGLNVYDADFAKRMTAVAICQQIPAALQAVFSFAQKRAHVTVAQKSRQSRTPA